VVKSGSTTRPTASRRRDYTITPTSDITLTTVSRPSIVAASAGFAASGRGLPGRLVVGNQIANTVRRGISDGSTVHVGGGVSLSATDGSASARWG